MGRTHRSDDPEPSPRYVYWADLLEVGDGESSLTVVGRAREGRPSLTVAAPNHQDPHSHHRTTTQRPWGDTLILLLTCGVVGALRWLLRARTRRARGHESPRPFAPTKMMSSSSSSSSTVTLGSPPTVTTTMLPQADDPRLHGSSTETTLPPRAHDPEDNDTHDKDHHATLPDLIQEDTARSNDKAGLTIVTSNPSTTLLALSQVPIVVTHSSAPGSIPTTPRGTLALTRQETHVDAEQVAEQVALYKQALARVGMQVQDDTVCQMALQRVAQQEHERLQEYREYRRLLLQRQVQLEQDELTERRHRETMESVQEDREWLGKVQGLRDRALATLRQSFVWGLAVRAAVGLVGKGHSLYQTGWYGVLTSTLVRLSHRCSPMTVPTHTEHDSWTAYLWSPLGGAYNYVSVASASVSKSSCYVMHGLLLGLALLGILLLVWATQHLPHMLQTALLAVAALSSSDMTLSFLGVWVTAFGVCSLLVWLHCRSFMVAHASKPPSMQTLNKFHLFLDDAVHSSGMLPAFIGIVYAYQLATRSSG